MNSISIIIIHYHNVQTTWECAASILTSNFSRFNVIIIDNGSIPEDNIFIEERCNRIGTPYQLIDREPDNLKYDRSISWYSAGNNLGYGAAMNVGAEIVSQSSPDFLLFLNNDVIVSPDLINDFLNETTLIKDESELGFASCLIRSWPDKEIWYAGGGINITRSMGEHFTTFPEDPGIHETGFISGCCMFCRPEVYKDLGGMDESFFLYLEDVDLCYRANQKGYKLFFIPRVELFHRVGSATGGDESEMTVYYSSRNRIKFMRKHFKGFVLYRFYTFFFLSRLAKTLKWGVTGKGILIKSLWRGIREGIKS